MKKWLVLGLVIILVFAGLLSARPFVIRRVVQSVVAGGFGADVEVREVHVNLRRSTLLLTGIQFSNPPDFPGDTALEIERLHVVYRPLSLFTRTVRLSRVDMDVQRVALVTNESGQMNLEHIARRSGARERSASPSAPTPRDAVSAAREESEAAIADTQGRRAAKRMHIERLTFRLAEVEMRDYSRNAPEPRVRNYRLNLERTFSDVHNLEEVARAVGADLAMTLGPQLLRSLLDDSGVRAEDLVETITTHEGDLDELGRKPDTQTKDLQRELRRQMRALREQSE